MKNKVLKILSITLILAISILQEFSYAKENPYTRQEFDKPTAEDKILNSSDTIISASKYNEYNPLNQIPVGINKEEYDSVNNFNVNLDTLETRIKCFSPTYLSIKQSAESSLWMSLYMRGGSAISADTFRQIDDLTDALNAANEYKDLYRQKNVELNELIKSGASDADINACKDERDTYKLYYDSYNKGYHDGIKSIESVEKAAGHKKALMKVADVDNNSQVANARDIVTKNIRMLVLNFLKLKSSVEVLKEQMDLNKSIYETYKRNYEAGAATALEVSNKLHAYESSKASYNSTNTVLKNIKEQVCINLGYDIKDIDKLVFIEPEPDIEYIAKINIDEDREKAYNSNAAYNSIKMSSKDKKLPGSTGEEIYNKKRQATAEKVVTALDEAYGNLQAAIWTYDGTKYLDEITRINDEANERKKKNNLVSDVEYLGLKLQNLANKLQVKSAKYDLIIAIDDYYYATMGQLSV